MLALAVTSAHSRALLSAEAYLVSEVFWYSDTLALQACIADGMNGTTLSYVDSTNKVTQWQRVRAGQQMLSTEW